MKKFYVLLGVILGVFFSGCTGVKSTVGGLDNESFLSFYSDNSSISDIEVTLQQKGNSIIFSAEVNR